MCVGIQKTFHNVVLRKSSFGDSAPPNLSIPFFYIVEPVFTVMKVRSTEDEKKMVGLLRLEVPNQTFLGR